MARKRKFKVGEVYEISDGGVEVVKQVTDECVVTDDCRYSRDELQPGLTVANYIGKKIDGVDIEGSDYPIGFIRGQMIVGCQKIPRKGQLQLFRKLADKLGYDLDE